MHDSEGPAKVDLGKSPGIDAPRPCDLEGSRGSNTGMERKPRRPIAFVAAIAAILLALGGVWYALFGFGEKAVPPPPPPPAPMAVARPVAPPAVEEEPAADPPREEVDYKRSAREKICTSLAREFLDTISPNPEAQRRTLMIYNINRCSNWFILKADAEGRGLDENELKAIDEYTDEEIGPLRAEDK